MGSAGGLRDIQIERPMKFEMPRSGQLTLRGNCHILTVLVCLNCLIAGCVVVQPAFELGPPKEFVAPDPVSLEREIVLLPISGQLGLPEVELSGLAWHGDTLVLLPQYPHKWGHSLFGLRRADLASAIKNPDGAPLEPFLIPLKGSEKLDEALEGYEGLEAVAFVDDQAYLLSEANMKTHMQGYILTGRVEEVPKAIQLDLGSVQTLFPQSRFMNQAYEALLPLNADIAAIFEANGRHVNEQPRLLTFGRQLEPRAMLSMAAVEYRLTDATALNEAGEFWMLNFHWPGSRSLMPPTDPIAEKWGEGPSQADSDIVERILKFKVTEAGVQLTEDPPLEFQLLNGVVARNWEGIALWGSDGFLVVTDQFPTTLLAYVAR